MSVDLNTARQITEQKLGRALSPRELSILTIVAADPGVTAKMLQGATVSNTGSGALFTAGVGVSSQTMSAIQQVDSSVGPSTALPGGLTHLGAQTGTATPTAAGDFNPNVSTTGSSTYDPGFGTTSTPSGNAVPYDPFFLRIQPFEMEQSSFVVARAHPQPPQPTQQQQEKGFKQQETKGLISPQAAKNERLDIQEGGIPTAPAPSAQTEQVGQYLKELAKDPNALRALQASLVGAGFSMNGFQDGVMDNVTENAVLDAIQETQRAGGGASLSDILSQRAKDQATLSPARVKALGIMGQDDFQKQVVAKYIQLWGTAPSQSWIDTALHSGQNLFELEFNEQNKPAFQNSPSYQVKHNDISEQAHQALNTETFTGASNPFGPQPPSKL